VAQRAHKYQQIADDLEADIIQGRLAAGSELPSEAELCARYDVTPTTVRRAMLELRNAGLVFTERGKRSIVKPKAPPRIQQIRTRERYLRGRAQGTGNWKAEMRAQGLRTNQAELTVSEEPAPHDIAVRLLIENGAPVIVRRRRFDVEGVPAQTYNTYYAAELARGTQLAEPAPIPGGSHRLIEDPHGPVNRRIARFVEDLTARAATDEEAVVLKLAAGASVVQVFRTAYDIEEQPLEVVDEVMAADLYEFQYVIDI